MSKTSAVSSSIKIHPSSELEFYGPFTKTQTSNIELSNLSNNRVAFKVKTTVPKRYCVRPVCGIIEPAQSAVVTVMLQPFEYETSERNKHKFMILTVPLTDFSQDTDLDLENLWKEVPTEKITDTRLMCILKMPSDILIIRPNKLIFELLESESSSITVGITNTSSRYAHFKVSSGYPKQLALHPEKGSLPPRGSTQINVTALPQKSPFFDISRDELTLISITSENEDSCDAWNISNQPEVGVQVIPCQINRHEQYVEDISSSENTQDLKAIIDNLKRENSKLRESQEKLRKLGVNEMPVVTTSGDPFKPILRYGYIPLIVYLLVTFIFALLVGKFVL